MYPQEEIAMTRMPSEILRIIDASLNRIGEGLRVLEEFSRMALDDEKLTQLLKDLRHDAVTEPPGLRLVESRNSSADVGRAMNVAGDAPSRGVRETVVANAKRAQESLRVLEDFAKMYPDELDSETYRAARFSHGPVGGG